MADEPEVLDPPKDPPAGDPPKEGDDPPKEPATISLDVLPDDLKDRPEAEVKFLLSHMITSLGSRNNEVDDLKTQIAELRGVVGATPPADPDPDDEKPMEELILEDVDKALDRWAAKRGYVDAVGDLSNRVGEAEFSMVSREIGDFDEHEEAVRKLLKDSKTPATRHNIMGAYKLALGESVIAERARDARANSGTIPPSIPAPEEPPESDANLSDLETEVMRAHGISDPKEWIQYRDNPPELKLPT